MNVTSNDFQLVNNWILDTEGPTYSCCKQHTGIPRFVIDKSTNRKYFNETPVLVGFKCFLLSLGTPLIHVPAALINMAYRLVKLVTLSHFRGAFDKQHFNAAGIDLLRIVAAPLAIVGLELAALYGMIRPYDGRKLYATIERATYGNFILAPCFQPDPKYHALGGDVNTKDVF